MGLEVTRATSRRIACLILFCVMLEFSGMAVFAATGKPDINPVLPQNGAADHQPQPDLIAVLPRGKMSQKRLKFSATQILPLSPDSESDLMKELLLLFAYEHDPLLRKLIKKKSKSQAILVAGAIGSFGVAVSQHLYVAKQVYGPNPLPKTTESALIRLRTPVVLALVYDGVDIFVAAVAMTWAAIYGRKVNKRKREIDRQVDEVFARLQSGVSDAVVKSQLASLLKSDASVTEYLNLWHVSQGHLQTKWQDTRQATPRDDNYIHQGRINRLQFQPGEWNLPQ